MIGAGDAMIELFKAGREASDNSDDDTQSAIRWQPVTCPWIPYSFGVDALTNAQMTSKIVIEGLQMARVRCGVSLEVRLGLARER